LVKKRKGYIEDFDINKVKKSLLKAGCDKKEAEKISQEIKNWVRGQPGKIVNSMEIERQVIERTKDKHKDVLISFLLFARNKIKPIKRMFNRNDIAQMLTSLFVIIQIYVLETVEIPFFQGIPVLVSSLMTCSLILWLIEGTEMWKHLISGFLLVTILSVIVGGILEVTAADIIIAISVGLPVAAMVDVIGNRNH
jgi:hypothetical protein